MYAAEPFDYGTRVSLRNKIQQLNGYLSCCFVYLCKDENLTARIRKLPGVALLYIAFNAINLESPSVFSRLKADEHVQTSMQPAAHEQAALNSLKESTFGKHGDLVHRRKHVKGPNPLSCKKKKVRDQSVGESRNSRKRTRKRPRKRAKTSLSSLQQIKNCLHV